nr:retrovirus-related Pol polyprotein from transposon 17.6 [Tanacetum cinerariifolium]
MNERCSVVLLNKLPSKEKDTGSFTIPCDIGHLHIDNALPDLGASISPMPYTMYEKLGLGEPKPTRMSSELADRRMPFGLCNALATFQRCMTAIFHDMVEDFMEVFMDDFLVFGNSFDQCLANLDKILARCEETNLVLNWKKIHFMVKEGIVLGHKISGKEIEVDKAKINVLLLQGFNIKIKDKNGAENLAAYHLPRLKNPNIGELTKEEIIDKFLDEHLMILYAKLKDDEPWNYFWDEPYAFRSCSDNVMRKYVVGEEILETLAHCHSGLIEGHHSASITERKVYESGFFWPKCDACQKSRNISSQSEMSQNNIQVCDVFDIWGLVDYVSKWVEAQALYE